jgi:hypothetical protein
MAGYGHYMWTYGVKYHGQYLNDMKEGYGEYYWADGRKYCGWWKENRQHGLGIYSDPNKGYSKYGLWEMTKRIKWFDKNEIQ